MAAKRAAADSLTRSGETAAEVPDVGRCDGESHGHSGKMGEGLERTTRRCLRAVIFDRDGTLVHDVPYNGDPARVVLVPGASRAVAAVRRAGLLVGMATNQRAVAMGLIGDDDVVAVNRRVEELVGPFDGVAWCPHDHADRCGCRKPAPGMVLQLAAGWGVDPSSCVVIGDTGADVGAALAAGGVGILVPNPVTAADEIAAAALVAPTVAAAVEFVLQLADAHER